MSSSNIDSALDALQQTINEILVQTGKAFKQAGRDGARAGPQGNIALRVKMPELHDSFHYALNKLEDEVIQAKGALLRDLERLRAQRMPVVQPTPVIAQSKEPLIIDLDSPEEQPAPDPPISTPQKAAKSAAPFPDMGMPMSATDISLTIKREKAAPQAAPVAPMSSSLLDAHPSVKAEAKSASAPQPPPLAVPSDSSMEDLFGLPDSAGTDLGNGGPNFTDMEFSLAPPGSEGAGQSQSQSADFDLTGFQPTDVGDSLMSLDGLEHSSTTHSQGATTSVGKPSDVKQENSTEDDIFGLDGSTSVDNMDLDVGLGNEAPEPSMFDDLLQEVGDSFGDFTVDLDHNEVYDDAYFGLT